MEGRKRGGDRDSSWTRRRVSCAGSCHFPILLARLQPVASWSLVAAQEEPGVEVYQIGRRLGGMGRRQVPQTELGEGQGITGVWDSWPWDTGPHGVRVYTREGPEARP